jgi:glycosyltransferase involved in cell wall biosynthesis
VGDIIDAFALAVAEQPRLFLLVGGEGPLTEQHQARVRELSIEDRVRFIGMLPEEELPPLFRRVNAYVSATAVDGTSVTLLQALACGTYVIASDIPGGRPWYASAATGTFEVGDVAALSAVLAGLHQGGIDKVARVAHATRVRQLADWSRNSELLQRITVGNATTPVL